jgi:hypothetical protein
VCFDGSVVGSKHRLSLTVKARRRRSLQVHAHHLAYALAADGTPRGSHAHQLRGARLARTQVPTRQHEAILARVHTHHAQLPVRALGGLRRRHTAGVEPSSRLLRPLCEVRRSRR